MDIAPSQSARVKLVDFEKAEAFRKRDLLDVRKGLQIRQDARPASQITGRQLADDNRMNQDLLLA